MPTPASLGAELLHRLPGLLLIVLAFWGLVRLARWLSKLALVQEISRQRYIFRGILAVLVPFIALWMAAVVGSRVSGLGLCSAAATEWGTLFCPAGKDVGQQAAWTAMLLVGPGILWAAICWVAFKRRWINYADEMSAGLKADSVDFPEERSGDDGDGM